jgi:Family of unknown function (DUF6088)
MRPRSSGDRASASGAEGRRFESCRGHRYFSCLERIFSFNRLPCAIRVPSGVRLYDRISIQFYVMSTAEMVSPGKALEKIPSGSFVRPDDLPGTPSARSSALSRAQKAGVVLPIRKGLYFKGVRTRYGMTRPSSEEVAAQVLGTDEGVGPTGVSAARTFGLTTQVPARPTLTVAGPVPTSVPGVRISKRNNMRRRHLKYTEIALLELLRGDWKTTVDGGWPALVAASEAAVRNRTIRPNEVRQVVDNEPPAARANYGRLVADLHGRGLNV